MTSTHPAPVEPAHRQRRTARTVVALMLREMATSYGRSPGGYLWAVAEPVAALALLSLVFSLAFAAPPLGTNFPLFYATGYLPFMLFNDVANRVATSIRFSKPLFAYPGVGYLDAILARFTLAVLTHLAVGALVLGGILTIFITHATPEPGPIVAALGLAAALALGIGTLNCYLMTAFPVWERAWQIATRPLFLISGIFFVYDGLPRAAQEILWFNPLMHIVGLMRQGFYGYYDGAYISPLYVGTVSIATLVTGFMLLYRHHRRLMED
ncbi:ABC transporter permease [Halodurantibacterium flavum]|uniref:ABC transporter permease n=1 Tax=Halodurantibacterium flavum TaxID=1382802 RepID=A0ABW4S4A9_9RHOB